MSTAQTINAHLKEMAAALSAASPATKPILQTRFAHEFGLNDTVYIYLEPGNVLSGTVDGITLDYCTDEADITYHVGTHTGERLSCNEDEVFATVDTAMAASHE